MSEFKLSPFVFFCWEVFWWQLKPQPFLSQAVDSALQHTDTHTTLEDGRD